MISISTTHHPATDLGYLLHKNPARAHEIDLSFGQGMVVFPEASEARCTAVLLVEVDPISLVRSPGGSLSQYVNDRPYVASSFLCTALTRAFGTAMSGKSKDRPDLVTQPIPLEILIPVLSSRRGSESIARLFGPLGYEIETTQLPLDPMFPEWGESNYFSVTLRAHLPLQQMLQHLYVLLPVLDARKHYFMDSQEVRKLLDKGEHWLAGHPEKDWIVQSYLGRKSSLIREALEQLANAEPEIEAQENAIDEELATPEPKVEKRKSLHEQRHERVAEVVRTLHTRSLVDLGCGDGKLIQKLVPIQGLDRIVGMDVSYFELEKASRRLRLETAGPKLRERIELIHGSLLYRDHRLEGFDAATAVEVIEHLDPPRLHAFERVVFECARPGVVIITTPNREYNAVYDELSGFRHEDHRFEWTRSEFGEWTEKIASAYGYTVEIEGLGEAHDQHGSPSQMGVFRR